MFSFLSVAIHISAMGLLTMPFAPGGAPVGLQDTTVRVERRAFVMGTEARVVVEGLDRPAALVAAEAALSEMERWEGLLSTWDPATPLHAANLAPVGHPAPLPQEVNRILAEAFAWRARTSGAFDPAVGALVDAWGLRTGGRTPTASELDRAVVAVGPASVTLDEHAGTLTRHDAAAWLDSGGFGKGAALRAAGDTLRTRGVTRALLDLGGQILVVGPPQGVGVAHPSGRQHAEVALRVGEASVATSGTSERGHHLLDPRTGRPAPAWGSVTVVSADPVAADALSTALYILGPVDGRAWAEAQDDVGALFLEVREGRLVARWNRAMEAWLHPLEIQRLKEEHARP